MPKRRKQSVKLTRQMLSQLLGDEEFFQKNLLFLFMRDQCLASYKKFISAQKRRGNSLDENGKSCCGSDPMTHMNGPIELFVRTSVSAFRTAGPQALSGIKDFISERLGYPVPAVCLYFKNTKGKTDSLEF